MELLGDSRRPISGLKMEATLSRNIYFKNHEQVKIVNEWIIDAKPSPTNQYIYIFWILHFVLNCHYSLAFA